MKARADASARVSSERDIADTPREPLVHAAGRYAFHGRTALLSSRATYSDRLSYCTEGSIVNLTSADASSLRESSRLEDLLEGSPWRCAVVGSSSALLGAKHGALIDSHDLVFRVHPGITRGFAEDVGRRTSALLLAPRRTQIAAFDTLTQSQPPDKAAIGLVAPIGAKEVAAFFRTARRRAALAETRRDAPRGKYPALRPLLLLSDKVYLRSIFELCAFTRRGQRYVPAHSEVMRPSTELLAVVVALQACANVSLFGMREAAEPCGRRRYFESARAVSCAGGVAGTRASEFAEHANTSLAMERSLYTEVYAQNELLAEATGTPLTVR